MKTVFKYRKKERQEEENKEETKGAKYIIVICLMALFTSLLWADSA